MTDTLRNSLGEPRFNTNTPVDVVIAHAIAKGTAAFDEYCTKVLNEKKTEGTAGMMKFRLRGAEPQQIVTQAKQILWGDVKTPGLIPQCALFTNTSDLHQLLLVAVADLQEKGSYTLCEAVGSFCRAARDAASSYDIAFAVKEFPTPNP